MLTQLILFLMSISNLAWTPRMKHFHWFIHPDKNLWVSTYMFHHWTLIKCGLEYYGTFTTFVVYKLYYSFNSLLKRCPFLERKIFRDSTLFWHSIHNCWQWDNIVGQESKNVIRICCLLRKMKTVSISWTFPGLVRNQKYHIIS